VHTHAAKAGALGRLAAWNCGVPVIVHTYHGHVFEGYFNSIVSGLIKMTERFLAGLSSAIIVISESQRSDIAVKFNITPSPKIHVVPLGFDLQKFRSDRQEKRMNFRSAYQIHEDEIVVGIIGRLTMVKNHDLFLRSVALLFKKNIRFRVMIIGDGEMRLELKENARRIEEENRAAEGNITFTSWIREMDKAIAGLDIVVLTSFSEGTPVSLIEAQAAGKPVVSTDVGGVRDCVQNGITGFIVHDNTAESFSGALEELILNKPLRRKFGTSGEHFVADRYDYKRLVNDVEKLYRSLLSHNNIS
jgi:glycosyltransferase involved in cell wall biosynthesis